MKKVIIFGGSGFLGSHVADALSDEGYKVVIFDLKKSPYLRSDQEMVVGDLMDIVSVQKACEGCDYVYNFAAVADISDAHLNPLKTVNINVVGTVNTLEAARLAKVKRYVFASSVYVYSNRGSFYRASKLSAEHFIETYNENNYLDYTILRYGTLYGKRSDDTNTISRILKQALIEGRMIYPGTGDELREYIHVEDAAKASVLVLEEKYKNQHLVLTGSEKLRVKDLMKMITEIFNGKVKVEYLNEQRKEHYSITPYTFHPTIGKKIVQNYYIDIGQGLLECISEIHRKLNDSSHTEGDWLVEND